MVFADDKWVRIMCDFSAEGVWDRSGAPADPSELPVSDLVRQRLGLWQERYELEADSSSWDDVRGSFTAEGLEIARLVKIELPDWTVVYFDEAQAALNAPRSLYEYEVR